MNIEELILLAELDPEDAKSSSHDFALRSAARAIVFDSNKKIALLNVTKKNFYKLPGGGIEEGEDFYQALRRECLEEIGCNIIIGDPVGGIIEYRNNKHPLKTIQKSYCYIAQVDGEKGSNNLTSGELSAGFKIEWINIEQTLTFLPIDEHQDPHKKYIVPRDLLFLQTAKKMLS